MYNHERPHSGRYCYGKTPWQTFLESKRLAQEKDLSKEPALSLSKGGIASDNVVEQPVPVG